MNLVQHEKLFVKQTHELGEWLGFETRNKYRIVTADGRQIGFAAEQQKGIIGFLLRYFLGHWRRFEIHFFDEARRPFLIARHPFRFLFQRLEIFGVGEQYENPFLGAIQQRFGIITKKFDVEDAYGKVILEVRSPIWKIWTFPFMRFGKEVGSVQKKWSGLLSEGLTDRDNFLVQFSDVELAESERRLMLAAALFIDLQYFERKAR